MSCWRCPECGYQYDEARGDPFEGLPPGTRWTSLPEDHVCPGCAVRARDDFVPCEERGTATACSTETSRSPHAARRHDGINPPAAPDATPA